MIPKVAKFIFKKDVMQLTEKILVSSVKPFIHKQDLVKKEQIKAAGAILNSNITPGAQTTPLAQGQLSQQKDRLKTTEPQTEKVGPWVKTVKTQNNSRTTQAGQAK